MNKAQELIVVALLSLLLSQATAQLQVIGAGFPRTGTSSLREALNILGYKTYHMKEVMKNEGHVKGWTAYLQGEKDVPEIAKLAYEDLGYTAAVDGPTCALWKELAHLYPSAKIILSERSSAEKWWDSASQTVFIPTLLTWALFALIPFWRDFGELLEHLWYKMFDLDRPRHITHQDQDICMAGYRQNADKVRQFMVGENADRVLVFQATQGWEPLCAFLGKPIPDVPFPHANSRKEFGVHMLKQGLVLVALPLVLVVGLLMYLSKKRKGSALSKTKEL